MLQFLVFSRPVRNHKILIVSLPEHSCIETKTVTFSDRKHDRNEIDVVTFHEREHTRITHGMHRFQDPHKELILDQLGLGIAKEN